MRLYNIKIFLVLKFFEDRGVGKGSFLLRKFLSLRKIDALPLTFIIICDIIPLSMEIYYLYI